MIAFEGRRGHLCETQKKMKRPIQLFLLVSALVWKSGFLSAQDPAALADSVIVKDQISVKTAIAGLSLLTAGTYVALSEVWYADFPKSRFHLFDDSREWLGMDKLGHVYATQHLSELGFQLFNKTGLSRRESAFAGTIFGWTFQFGFELMDGRNQQWGFSLSDVAANTVGAGMFWAQSTFWNRQYIRIKYSYAPTEYAEYRPTVLGSTHPERFMKDYNGQTYWLSGSPFALTSGLKKWDWLCLSFGYSVDAKLHGHLNYFATNNQVFQAQSEYVLSLDINIDAMAFERQWVKKLLTPLRWIKIPFPAMVIDNQGVDFRPFYF